MSRVYIVILIMAGWLTASGQGPVAGFMPGMGVTDLALGYAHESFERYFYGRESRQASHSLQSFSLFLEHGFSDSTSVVISLPYIWTERQAGSLQDATLVYKFRPLSRNVNRGLTSLTVAGGMSFPAAAYAVDTLFPMGIRATSLMARVVWQTNFASGWFMHVQTGYELRVLPDVVSAIPVLLRAGYGARRYYVETWLEWYNSLEDATGVRLNGGPGADWFRVGGVLYVPVVGGLGVVGGWSQVLSGKNIGISGRGHVGLVMKLRQNIARR